MLSMAGMMIVMMMIKGFTTSLPISVEVSPNQQEAFKGTLFLLNEYASKNSTGVIVDGKVESLPQPFFYDREYNYEDEVDSTLTRIRRDHLLEKFSFWDRPPIRSKDQLLNLQDQQIYYSYRATLKDRRTIALSFRYTKIPNHQLSFISKELQIPFEMPFEIEPNQFFSINQVNFQRKDNQLAVMLSVSVEEYNQWISFVLSLEDDSVLEKGVFNLSLGDLTTRRFVYNPEMVVLRSINNESRSDRDVEENGQFYQYDYFTKQLSPLKIPHDMASQQTSVYVVGKDLYLLMDETHSANNLRNTRTTTTKRLYQVSPNRSEYVTTLSTKKESNMVRLNHETLAYISMEDQASFITVFDLKTQEVIAKAPIHNQSGRRIRIR